MSTSITPGAGQQETRRATTFGMRLKQEREQRGITLDQISQSTKIGTRFLQALEQDHFEQLPGGIFNKGFVRAYARFVGIDEEEAVADYLTATGDANQPRAESVDKAPIIELPAEPERSRAAGVPWGVLAPLLLIIAFAFAIWGFYSRVTNTRSQPPVQPAPVQTTAPAVPSPAPERDQTSKAKSSAQPSASRTPVPGTASSATSPSTNALTSTREAAVPHDLVLRIKAQEDAWISVHIDGEVSTQETLVALSEKTIHARQQIIIRAGNIGALDFEFKGKSLPSQGKVGEVKTLVFDASGWHALPKPVPSPAPEAQP